MPNIFLPNSATDESPANAAEASENLFTPRQAPNTLAGMNGFLDEENLDATVFPIQRELVRPGVYSRGDMVGATANQDFFEDWYRSFSTPLEDLDQSSITVPGAEVTYRLEFPVTQLFINWQVGVICDGPADLINAPPSQLSADPPSTYCSMRLYNDGFPVPRYTQGFKGSCRTLLDRQKAKYQYPNNPLYPDHRWWTCTAVFYLGDPHSDSLPAGVIRPFGTGFHTAEIRVAQRGNVARCKTRNMSYKFNR